MKVNKNKEKTSGGERKENVKLQGIKCRKDNGHEGGPLLPEKFESSAPESREGAQKSEGNGPLMGLPKNNLDGKLKGQKKT